MILLFSLDQTVPEKSDKAIFYLIKIGFNPVNFQPQGRMNDIFYRRHGLQLDVSV